MNSQDRGGHRRHKDLQLCRQVFDALAYALAELDDPMIAQLVLASVMPVSGSGCVLVTLVPTRDDVDVDAAQDALRGLNAALRAEVAAEITRKRVPELMFRIAPRDLLS